MEDEEEDSNRYEYDMPLSGVSSRGASTDSDFSGAGMDTFGRDYQEPISRSMQFHSRRSSNQTDATPPFQNTTDRFRFDYGEVDEAEELEEEDFAREELPFPQPPLHAEHHSQRSFSKETHGIQRAAPPAPPSARDSVSYSSQNTPTTPSSKGQFDQNKSLARHLEAHSLKRESSAMQITFDGQVREVPLHSPRTPVSKTSTLTSNFSTNHSWGDSDIVGQGRSRLSHPVVHNSRPQQDIVLSPLLSSDREHIQLDILNPYKNAPAYRQSIKKMDSNPMSDHLSPDKQRQSSEDIDDAMSVTYSDTIEPILICNVALPLCISRLIKQPPRLAPISMFLVRVAPCFWCSGLSSESSTDRAVLHRLNVLCLFFTFIQQFSSLWLAALLLIVDDQPGLLDGFAPHFWNLNGAVFSVGILAFIIIVTCVCTIRVVREVDLVGAIRYLWVILWIFPFEIFFNISLFDYFNVSIVWIRHWWLEPQMSWFREYFCAPETSDSLCSVPIDGGADHESEDDWCQALYESTNCTHIRNNAQEEMEFAMLTFYTALAGWGCVLLFLMLLMVNSLERIITKPIVQKSRETNVPAWLLLPTVGNALVGSIFLFSPSSLLSDSAGGTNFWIGALYLVAAFLFLIALLLGWFLSAFSIRNSGDKKTKNVAVVIFIGVMAANTLLLGTIFVASIIFSANLIQSPIGQGDRGDIACIVDRDITCTQCNDPISRNRCPEWTLDEVTRILQTQLKQSASLAAIFILYAISVTRYGFVLRKHLAMYQIDYV